MIKEKYKKLPMLFPGVYNDDISNSFTVVNQGLKVSDPVGFFLGIEKHPDKKRSQQKCIKWSLIIYPCGQKGKESSKTFMLDIEPDFEKKSTYEEVFKIVRKDIESGLYSRSGFKLFSIGRTNKKYILPLDESLLDKELMTCILSCPDLDKSNNPQANILKNHLVKRIRQKIFGTTLERKKAETYLNKLLAPLKNEKWAKCSIPKYLYLAGMQCVLNAITLDVKNKYIQYCNKKHMNIENMARDPINDLNVLKQIDDRLLWIKKNYSITDFLKSRAGVGFTQQIMDDFFQLKPGGIRQKYISEKKTLDS